MERIVDLDAAAGEIHARRAVWEAAGFTVGPVTWRDHAENWPQHLITERTAVFDPDSVGVRVDHGDCCVAYVVLFRGGWADVDVIDPHTEEVHEVDGSGITSVEAFGKLLDQVTARLLGGS
ncbi:hypothetical protein [Crossiella cryophila]|uniref:8-oxo-dGTP pyrophosphatase MutT (NUDIX family) n=1 Tax=Crossiella cryophila TaxID=43355 RepID=A0A7W7FTB3_9PSEU|nr:hypothetical protein [Crossiella cryophila]MBB4674619.1 8-oxo-dGTP pyrophosphatase MutT (NUDIX family) [Crossiella cryophila]